MNYFLLFHHNLAFSSIPTDHYSYLIDKVYSGLLDIAEGGIPLALEYTGETLEKIRQLRPNYTDRLQKLIADNQVELVGSSYSQAIFPLIPAKVNRWNLHYGLKTYEEILGSKPSVALINEQCYADSLAGLYRQAGYKSIIMDWMNARTDNHWPEHWRYTPVRHSDSGLLFLWSDCISFQKLQRTVWGDLEESEWIDFLSEQYAKAASSPLTSPVFSLYGSDAEVFDYQPGSLGTWNVTDGHIKKLQALLDRLQIQDSFSIVLPSQALAEAESLPLPEITRVCSPSYPIRTKKQNKYNVTRWAVTGRASSRMNTQCFKLLTAIEQIEADSMTEDRLCFLKKELTSLWGSDFRTHTTDEKIENFRNRMGTALYLARHHDTIRPETGGEFPGRIPPSSRPVPKETSRKFKINKGGTSLVIAKNRGLAIDSFACSHCGPSPLLGTIPHGYFPDIALASDFYTGHIMLLTQDGRQITDLSVKVPELLIQDRGEGILVKNRDPMQLPGLTVFKHLYLEENRLTIHYEMYASDLRPASLRLGICTLMPESFQQDSLFYETANGGDAPERFGLQGATVCQDAPVNHTVTCRHCLGTTNGYLVVGDATKKLTIAADPTELYSVPLIHYEEVAREKSEQTFFFRIYHTICERDDVANVFWKGKMSLTFKITASCNEHSSTTR